MLHVLLQILAILGIILLCILGLLILVLLLILFVPIRYKAMGKKDAENQEIHVKVSYLLHILSVCYDLYGKESDLRIKIFGIRLKSGKKKKIKKVVAEEAEEAIKEETTDLVAAQDTPLTTEDGPVESEQKDKDTMFNIEVFDGNGSIFYIMLPINITKLKTIEYSYIRNAFLSEKNDDEFIKLVRYHHQTLKNMYSRKFKSDKELRRVIKEGIERIKKNGRHF